MKEVMIEGERVFLQKGYFGWRTINPWKIDGNINWKNLIAGGSWIKLLTVAAFSVVLVMAIMEVNTIISIANECLKNQVVVSL